MYYDYEDKRYHEGEPPADSEQPESKPYEMSSPAWSEPAYRAADEQPAYSPGYGSSGMGYTAYNNRYQSRNWNAPAEPKKKSGAGKRFLRALCLVLVCALVSATVGYGVADYRIKNTPVTTTENRVVLGSGTAVNGTTADKKDAAIKTTTGDVMSGGEIYSLACSQVVGIQTAGGSTVNVFGQMTNAPAVSGSGFIISTDGYIATNCHVIEYTVRYGEQYGYKTTVIMQDGTSYPAEIVGYDQDNDVAVLKIDATGLSAVTFGSSENMGVGDRVYAVGNPLGELEYTMTSGIVSALDREITTEESVAVNMFQIDAAVNPGNSGGPVYNEKGEVIGIVTAKSSETGVEGIGFAIPIDDALNIISDLIEHGYVLGKAYMGVTLQTLGGTYIRYYNLPEGAYVETVVDGTAAANAGIQVGDLITKIDGTTVTSREAVKAALRDYSAGDTAVITVYRSGQYYEYTITFDEYPHGDTSAPVPAAQVPGN